MRIVEETKIFDGTFIDDHTFVDADGNEIELRVSEFDDPPEPPEPPEPPKEPPKEPPRKPPKEQKKLPPDDTKLYIDIFENKAYKWSRRDGAFVEVEMPKDVQELLDGLD